MNIYSDSASFHFENNSFDFYLKSYFLIAFVQFGDMSLAPMIPLMELSSFLENVNPSHTYIF